jgi:ribosomal protein S18 acetylase RimI-like enzyme
MAEARSYDALRVSIRPPQPADIRDLERAERLCFDDPWPSQYFVSELFAPGRFHRLMVDPAGGLVAYLFAAWQYLDLHILKVATLPPYRRSGLARRLMDLAEQHVVETGGDSLTLEVRPNNDGAIAMYRTLGYHDAGLRPGYYADGTDAVIMTKRVDG